MRYFWLLNVTRQNWHWFGLFSYFVTSGLLALLGVDKDTNEVGVSDKFGGSKSEESKWTDAWRYVGVSDDEAILLLLEGLVDGVKNSELSGGQEFGLLRCPESCEGPKLIGETVLPLCSYSRCFSHSCFFLPASFLYFFRQLLLKSQSRFLHWKLSF